MSSAASGAPSSAEGSSGPQTALQRGKACLRCRKRKMRCDGSKPACQQCTRAKKADACEYDDGKGKTRTQVLRETIVKLEQRVRELEDPEFIASTVSLFDPTFHSRSNSSSSSIGSPESASYLSASPFHSDASASPAGSWAQLSGTASPAPFVPDIFFDEPPPTTRFQPPPELARMLIDIFSPHARQCGLEVSIVRLRDCLSLSPSEQRHPVLMNAIYLWACFISRPEPLSQHEDHYLQQAVEALPEALKTIDKAVDVVQASCLLSLYFLANGRLLEGSYHASAAACLAVQTGLGARSPTEPLTDVSSDPRQTKADSRDGERILAFWQIYNLDRCWSVVLRKPCAIPDSIESQHSITCPWPQDINDYENGVVDVDNSAPPTIQAFLSGSISATSFTVSAMRVKASTLIARADQLSRSWSPGIKPSPTLTEQVQSLEHVITLFQSTLIPIGQLDAILADERHSLIIAHTLAHCATIHLHRSFSLEDAGSYEKCSQASRSVVAVIRHISEQDFAFLEPIVGPSWWSAADIIIRDLDALEASWPLVDQIELRNDLGVLLYAMTSLSTKFPVVAPAVAKVQKRLASYTS